MREYDILFFIDELHYRDDNFYYSQSSWQKFAVKIGEALGRYKLILPIKPYRRGLKAGRCSFLTPENVEEVKKGWESFKEFILKFPLCIKELIKLRHLFRRAKVLMIRLPSLAGFFLYLLTRFSSKDLKIVIHIGGNILSAPTPLIRGGFFKRGVATFCSQLIHFSQRIMVRNNLTFTAGEELQKLYAPYCGKRIFSILSSPIEKNKIFYRNDSCQGQVIKILKVAQLIPRKGVEYLIEAVKKLVEEGFKVELLIVGEGDQKYERFLKDLVDRFSIADKIHFLGFLPWGKGLEDIYKKGDIFVLSSLNEGFPRVILEAWAFSLPVVATKVSGIPSIVKDRENGLLVEPKNIADLHKKIKEIILSENLRKKIIKRGSEILAEKYTQEKIVEFIKNKIIEEIEE